MTTVLEGATVTTTATFTDIAGALVDPATVELTVQAPDGTQTTPVPTNPSVGVYAHEQTLDQTGNWWFHWEGETEEGTAVTECVVCAKPVAVTVGS